MLLLALVAYYYTTRNFLPIERAVDALESERYLHLLNQPFVVIGIVYHEDFSFVSNIYKQYDNLSGEYWFFYIKNKDLQHIPLHLENNYTPQNYIMQDSLHLHLYSKNTIYLLNNATRNHVGPLFDFTNYPNRDDLHKQHILHAGTVRRGIRSYEVYFSTNAPFRHQGNWYILVNNGFLLELPYQFMHDGHRYNVLGDDMTFERAFSDSYRTVDYSTPL